MDADYELIWNYKGQEHSLLCTADELEDQKNWIREEFGVDPVVISPELAQVLH